VEFRNEQQKLAVKRAFLRITADDSWLVMKQLAEETVYALEQKSLQEDDEDKAKTLPSRCARSEKVLGAMAANDRTYKGR